jgi:hypothetical protein
MEEGGWQGMEDFEAGFVSRLLLLAPGFDSNFIPDPSLSTW